MSDPHDRVYWLILGIGAVYAAGMVAYGLYQDAR